MNALKKQGPIMQEEIDAINAKHTGLLKSARGIVWKAIEIGQWFLDAHERMGVAGSKRAGWTKWLDVNFPRIRATTVWTYMRLAKNRKLVETKFSGSEDLEELEALPTLRKALEYIDEVEEQEGRSHKKKKVIDIEAGPASSNGTPPSQGYFSSDRGIKVPPPPEVQELAKAEGEPVEDPGEEPLEIVRGLLKSYAWQRWQLDYQAAEILERIKVAEITSEQVEQLIEWASLEHPEVKETMLGIFARG